jgi:thymidylate kinase
MSKAYVVLSGLPGSGKTTLGRELAPALDLPLIDKDDILERLFGARGIGGAGWRRLLSREADDILQREVLQSDGAVVVSFWHLPGMPADSGTPTDWLRALPAPLLNVHCVCAPEVAARRFLLRRRHAGHLDDRQSFADVLESVRELDRLAPLNLQRRLEIDTSQAAPLDEVVRSVRDALSGG